MELKDSQRVDASVLQEDPLATSPRVSVLKLRALPIS